jgi:HD-like signal output (HDOD) protein
MRLAKITQRALDPRGRAADQARMAVGAVRKGTGKRKGEPGYGEGEVELAFDDEVLLDEAELGRRLADVFESPGYAPPRLPGVAVEILELSRQPEASFAQFASLLEQDAMLAGEVMKLVRSPLYAGQVETRTLQQALVRIGVKNLRDIVLQAALNMRVFRCDAYRDAMDRLRRHAAACAQLCRIVGRYTALEAEYAFLCGLLHDVGIAATLIALAEGAKAPPDLVAIWPAVERVHPRAAHKLSQLWNLPADVGLAALAHHQVKLEGHAHPLAATVCLADQIAHERGLGLAGDAEQAGTVEAACLAAHFAIDRSTPATLAAAREALQLTDKQLALIARDAEKVIASGED